MLKGIGSSAGIAIAEIVRLEEPDLTVIPIEGLDPAAEKERYSAAAKQALAELDALYERARETDEDVAQVFDIHRMMLDDPDFCEGIDEALSGGVSAEYAVQQTAENLSQMFLAMEGDEYMQARAADVSDVYHRLIRI